jgi:hypothetical protein
VRNAFLEDLDLIERFVDENPSGLDEGELEIVRSWRHLVAGKFFMFRQLQRHMVFLLDGEGPVAYGVVALTEPFEDLVGPYLPVLIDTVLLPFRDKIVYDGLLSCPGVTLSFGAGIRRMLNESYKRAKQHQGIVTKLPPEAITPMPERAPSKPKARPTETTRHHAAPAEQVIRDMVESFCREHLNEEYAALCRKLTDKLARKRPSPLVRGRPNTWACAIVRTIGLMNFLDDRSQTPHMKLTAIDKAFGVGESTGQGKSMEIRRMLKIRRFDHHWVLPSRIDEYPLMWMLEVNGLLMDIRDCPREAQQIAFEKGLIPYVPADREHSLAEEHG